MTLRQLHAIAFATSALLACHDRVVDAPASVSGEPVPNLFACAELLTASVTIEDSMLTTEAGPAGCAADGLECALDDHPDLAGCDAGEHAVGLCDLHRWWFNCRELAAGGGAGGGGAAGSEGAGTAGSPGVNAGGAPGGASG